MEVPSSTEWSFDSRQNRFAPNYFVEIGKEGVNIKIRAYPFTKVLCAIIPIRIQCGIEGLAAYRGVQAGCNSAEAFECVFRRIE